MEKPDQSVGRSISTIDRVDRVMKCVDAWGDLPKRASSSIYIRKCHSKKEIVLAIHSQSSQ